jgi:hypothetical protein
MLHIRQSAGFTAGLFGALQLLSSARYRNRCQLFGFFTSGTDLRLPQPFFGTGGDGFRELPLAQLVLVVSESDVGCPISPEFHVDCRRSPL